MTQEMFIHYTCEFCGKEMVAKSEKDTGKWIVITNGTHAFDHNNKLLISYMVNDYRYLNDEKNQIKHDLHFCCKECLVRYLYLYLKGSNSEADKLIDKLISEKTPGKKNKADNERFSDLE